MASLFNLHRSPSGMVSNAGSRLASQLSDSGRFMRGRRGGKAALGALLALGLLACTTPLAHAIADFVEHRPNVQVFGEPAGVTMREGEIPREDEPVDLWVKIGFSFFYSEVAIYYTLDGSEPNGALGVPAPGTSVLRSTTGDVQFVRNQPTNIDWWRGRLPTTARAYGTRVRYKISAIGPGSAEVFANNYGCADGTCDDPAAPATTFEYQVKLAWPGAGAPSPNPGVGYPPVYFWKEEAVVGNNFINVQLDQNGTVYDIYYPGAGGVQGVGTKNEGYVDGIDTFPPGLPPGARGQMHLNQAMGGIRVGGVTYWLSNQNGVGYTGVSQRYLPRTNTVRTEATLTAAGNNIHVEQYDFSPRGTSFPTYGAGTENRGIYLKRYLLTNRGDAPQTINFYFYGDFAINGGDGFDGMGWDVTRGAMIAVDNTRRFAAASGEYNPTTFSDYDKNVSITFAGALKVLDSVGGASGQRAVDAWRDTSGDNGQGWIGAQLTLQPNVTREIDVAIVGGFDPFAGATGTYDVQIAPAVDWFYSQSVADLAATTNANWQAWLTSGVTVDTPDDRIDELFERGLLCTALHIDGRNGGVIAGYHNGAYPYVWPRDAVYAAVTLARTGHAAESAGVYRYLRDVCFRGTESWGRGFWYQKYTTDGYIIWSAPQVDETAVFPWGLLHHGRVTGDMAFLADYFPTVLEASYAMSSDSALDSRLYYDDTFQLMHSNNVWEDSYDLFIYSNANVIRGLADALTIARMIGQGFPASINAQRFNIINGLNARLDWNGENTDISQLGIVYPFRVLSPTSARAALVMDRINGVAADRFGQVHPLVNFSGEFQDLINRYWGDGYWRGGPWFLSTLWYGLFYAERQQQLAGKADIDNHYFRINRTLDFIGPAGLGAEQMAPSNSLLYPGQPDFRLQTAWPNAWESMSTYADAVMAFLGYEPFAGTFNTVNIRPILPTAWPEMTFRNVQVGERRFDAAIREGAFVHEHIFTNVLGGQLRVSTAVRVPSGRGIVSATRNGIPLSILSVDSINRLFVTMDLNQAPGSVNTVRVVHGLAGDMDCDGDVDFDDINGFVLALTGETGYAAAYPACYFGLGDADGDGDVDFDDIDPFVALLVGG